ncbi:MAG: glycosyltransferase family 4 protein [Blastocatellia bacterium]
MLKNNLRILFLTQTHNLWGGIESWFYALTLWLQRKEWNVHVGLAKGAQYNNPKAFIAAHPHINNPIILDASVGTEEARIQSIIKSCRASSPDVVMPLALGSIFPAMRRLKQDRKLPRLIIPVHSLHQEYLQNVIDNFDVIDQVVGVSRLIEQFFLEALPYEAKRIHYIRNGVNSPIKKRLEYDGTLRIGYIGRLDNLSKRVLDIIPLVAYLREAELPMEIHLYGDGPERERLSESLSSYQNHNCRIIFHGYIENTDLYQIAYPYLDVLLLLSPTEGSPLALYEAMHHGVVPVVSRFLGHASEGVIRHGKNAFTFEIGDVKAASSNLMYLANHPTVLAEFSEQAKKDVAEYLLSTCNSKWEDFLLKSLELPPRVPGRLDFNKDANLAYGRLERLGISQGVSNKVRWLLNRKFPHRSGFEEWPGTQPVDEHRLASVTSQLLTIEAAAASHIYSEI